MMPALPRVSAYSQRNVRAVRRLVPTAHSISTTSGSATSPEIAPRPIRSASARAAVGRSDASTTLMPCARAINACDPGAYGARRVR